MMLICIRLLEKKIIKMDDNITTQRAINRIRSTNVTFIVRNTEKGFDKKKKYLRVLR